MFQVCFLFISRFSKFSDACARFYSLHARPGMNVIVRRDVGPYYVLGGGSGNETTYYEFEKGVQVDPGYHVYQVTVFAMMAVVHYTESRFRP